MSIEQKLKGMLEARGMSSTSAQTVIDIVKSMQSMASMNERWTHSVDDYPEPMMAVLWVAVKRAALDWIDANCPQAWFRPLFTMAV